MFEITKETKLPRLSSDLKLVKGEPDEDGAPTWRLYNPVSHQYFKIGWVEFEYLSRFSLYTDYGGLRQALIEQTTLEPDEDVFRELLLFLNQHGLLHDDQTLALTPPSAKQQAVLSEIVHKYLFFSVPLVKPDNFLKVTYPYVAWLFTNTISFITIIALTIAVLITLGRIDEFFTTFLDMFSPQGALIIGVTFTIIKIFHELGHAYSAHKHGLKVPHMGIAFMVMYPVFYTETTSAWHLASKKDKVQIGLGGIRIELIFAAIFLLVWNYTGPGLLQSIAFSVVAISLVGSLLINLNPLMRFDGYFILSDMLGIENLHSRSFACARWKLRKVLFGWKDEPPEDAHPSKLRLFITFGWATIIYRFFLFMGIAILVYTLFPKPLGLILMIIEIAWFILRPMGSEIKVWFSRSSELMAYWRGRMTFGLFGILLIMLFLPVQSSISAPAVYHAQEHADFYAPYPSKILSFRISENRKVEKGEVLLKLESPELEKDYKVALVELEELEKLKRRQQTNADLIRENLGDIDSQIEQANLRIASFRNKQKQLRIRAPFSGYIKDTDIHLHEGRYIDQNTLLFRLINTEQAEITAYVTENELARISLEDQGTFLPDYSLGKGVEARIRKIDETNVSTLDKRELSSVYGGPVYSETFQEQDQLRVIPRQALYRIILQTNTPSPVMSVPGILKIEAESALPINIFMKRLYQFILPESDVI